MIRIFELEDYLKKNNCIIPSNDKFGQIVDNLSYFESNNGEILNTNYERGILLYSLITKFRPENVLEFGTGKGFGTVCIAWALDEINNNGNFFTIDFTTHDEKIHYYKESNKIQSKIITRKELWEKVASPLQIKRIKILSGYTSEVISKTKFPKIQFFYIDGAHFYEGVKHDFLSSLLLASQESYFLFDDYIDRPSYGVKKFIDDEISQICDIDIIKTDSSNYFIRNGITDKEYGMCFLKIQRDDIINYFGINNIKEFLNRYQSYEKRYKLRNKLNSKIPFLKKIRFSKFIK